MLDFSKVDAGELTLESLSFPLVGMIDAAISIVRGSALKSGLAIKVDLDPALPRFVVGDSGRLRQVLLNLLNNAVKFTPEGSVTLSVQREGEGTVSGGGTGEALRFSITDTGIGIAPADQVRLFRRFSQVDDSISRRFGGTGLGLAISHQLVELMGGTIGVTSGEGVGSTFWFTLVLQRGDEPSHENPQAKAEPAAAGAQPGLRLLLAEDVAINRELACAVLEAQGYEVAVAVDGEEAVTAVESAFAAGHGFDLVLMDVQMPGVDGLAATRRIRNLAGSARDVPIVAMTANVLPEQIEDLIRAGMDDHVGKPFKRQDLFATIGRWTEPGARQHHARPVPSAPPKVDPQILDADVLDGMRLRFGPERVNGLLDMLAGELSQRFRTAANDRNEIAHDAHAMVSAAGMLGFAGCRNCAASWKPPPMPGGISPR